VMASVSLLIETNQSPWYTGAFKDQKQESLTQSIETFLKSDDEDESDALDELVQNHLFDRDGDLDEPLNREEKKDKVREFKWAKTITNQGTGQKSIRKYFGICYTAPSQDWDWSINELACRQRRIHLHAFQAKCSIGNHEGYDGDEDACIKNISLSVYIYIYIYINK
jgi:hypothetical protein